MLSCAGMISCLFCAHFNSNQLAELKAQQLTIKAAAHEAWTAGKDALLQQDDYSNANLGVVIALKKKVRVFCCSRSSFV